MDSIGQGYMFADSFAVTNEVKKDFDENGFIVIRNLLNDKEVNKLCETLESDSVIEANSYERSDGEGTNAKYSSWSNPGEDIAGLVSRCDKIVGTVEKLLNGEVYHYHSKVIVKEPFSGGVHVWHQDYGYWYQNGCLFPDMATVWIAVDKADRHNGCLKIIPRSQKCGRLEHTQRGEQGGVYPERVAHIEKILGLLYAEMEPGDALFFHCNLLHRSEVNNSPRRRMALLCCYNKATNNPVIQHQFPQYTKLQKVRNSAILDAERIAMDVKKNVFFGGAKFESVTGLFLNK